jgi:hypothetical protein
MLQPQESAKLSIDKCSIYAFIEPVVPCLLRPEHLATPNKEVASMKRTRILRSDLLRTIRRKLSALMLLFFALPVQAQHDPKLQQIAAFPDQQVTGITVASDGRIFVNFPYWSESCGQTWPLNSSKW